MNISKIDLNLLVYLDVLLREKNVTRAANQLSITQPAMSNGLKRLRDLLNDPILVRTSDGMVPTERAKELAPVVRGILLTLEETLQPNRDFEPQHSHRVFRIMASDYA
ncbi:MAG: LysR family transcriptional regulator, partial [Gammaproteobacteria bacterium]|nr:LysR family transcriptional regulator [Gammaproteobacteria bacterium]